MKRSQKQKDKITKRKSRKSSSKRINRVRRLSKDKNIRRSKNRNSKRKSNRKSRRINRNNKKTRRRRRKSKSKSKKLIKGGGEFMDRFVADLIGDMIKTGALSQDPETEQKAVKSFGRFIGPSTESPIQAAFRGENYRNDPNLGVPGTSSGVSGAPSAPTTTDSSAPTTGPTTTDSSAPTTDSSAPTTGTTPTSMEMMMVTCPDGVQAGDKIQVNLPDGSTTYVIVPAGVVPGQQFQVEVQSAQAAAPIDPNATLFTNDMEPGLYDLYTPNTKGKGTYYIYLIDAKSDDDGNFGKGQKFYYVHLESDKQITYTEPEKKRRWWKDIPASTEVIDGSTFDYKISSMDELLANRGETSGSKLYCESVKIPSFETIFPGQAKSISHVAELLCLYFVGMTMGINKKYVRFAYPSRKNETLTRHMFYHTGDGIISLGEQPIFQLVSAKESSTSSSSKKLAAGISGDLLLPQQEISSETRGQGFELLSDKFVKYDEAVHKHTHHYLKITASAGMKVFSYADGRIMNPNNIGSGAKYRSRYIDQIEDNKAYIRIPLFSPNSVNFKDIFFVKEKGGELTDITIHPGIRLHKESQAQLLKRYASSTYEIALAKVMKRINDDNANQHFRTVVGTLLQGAAPANVTIDHINRIIYGRTYDHTTGEADPNSMETRAGCAGGNNAPRKPILLEIKAILSAKAAREDRVSDFQAVFSPYKWSVWFDAVKEEMGEANFDQCQNEIRCLPKWGEKTHEAFNSGFRAEINNNGANGCLNAYGHKAFSSKDALNRYNERFCKRFPEGDTIEGLDLAPLITRDTQLSLCTMWIGPSTAPPEGSHGYIGNPGGLLGRTQRYGLMWCLEKELERRRFNVPVAGANGGFHDKLNNHWLRESCIGRFPGVGGGNDGLKSVGTGDGGNPADHTKGRWLDSANNLMGVNVAQFAALAGPPLSVGAGVNKEESQSIVKTFAYLGCTYQDDNFHPDLQAAIRLVKSNKHTIEGNPLPLFNHINSNSWNGNDQNAFPDDTLPTSTGGTPYLGTGAMASTRTNGGQPMFPPFGIPIPIAALNYS